MKSLIKYFGCGNLYSDGNKSIFKVIKFSDITQKIIPCFQKHPIQEVKALDFAAWYEVAYIMKNKGHLTQEGLDKIRQIKAGMNIGIKFIPTVLGEKRKKALNLIINKEQWVPKGPY